MIRAALLSSTVLLFAATPSQGVSPPTFDAAAAHGRIEAILDRDYPHLDALYKDIHTHPELARVKLKR